MILMSHWEKLEHRMDYRINNEVWVGVGEIDPGGSVSLPETAKPLMAVSEITRDQSRLSHKMS